ncbi:MAG TPA: GNAT family N-acetyltransferase [Deltaproteobacteria bacterium]|nr:GNAT family N-acetyltransferase [Deltaproteobacteria bacterium]
MKIRTATNADIERISQVHIASIRSLCNTHYSREQLDSWTSALTSSAYDHALREKVFLVAEDPDKGLLGLGMLDIENAQISAIYIHPDASGRGTGALLLSELESIAHESNIDELTVHSTLNAQGFYTRLGYVKKFMTTHTLPDGSKLECIQMTKDMSPATE